MKSQIYLLLLAILIPRAYSAAYCVFHNDPSGRYACRLENGNFLNVNDGFTIRGTHMIYRGDQDVRVLFTHNSILRFVPTQIFDRFQNLERLDLVDSGLQTLHQPWRNCSSLGLVRLENNAISTIPDGIFQACNNIDTLTFAQCRISQINPNAFIGLSQLRTLRIHRNALALTTLHVNTFNPIGNLQRLELDSLGLQRIQRETLLPLQSLTFLTLAANNITTIETGTFVGFSAMEQLHINSNRHLNFIERQSFGVLDSLVTLNLYSTNINRLNRKSFGILTALTTLNIREIGLQAVERSFFENFPNMRILDAQLNTCVNTIILKPLLGPAPDLVPHFNECFTQWEMSETTLGASSIASSLGLILSVLILMKLWFICGDDCKTYGLNKRLNMTTPYIMNLNLNEVEKKDDRLN